MTLRLMVLLVPLMPMPPVLLVLPMLLQDKVGGALRQGEDLRDSQVRRGDGDHGAVNYAHAPHAVHAQLKVDHRVALALAHAARATAVVHGGPHVGAASTVLDGPRRQRELGGVADFPRPLRGFRHARQVLRVGHGLVRDDGAHVRGASGERDGTLCLRLTEGRKDGVGVGPKRPLLALQRVLQGGGLGRVVERHEGEHNVGPRGLGVRPGRSR
mmetsp:Transcript_20242/g.55171  ORF Transcript_20242/g.55171 Transcript_20242/m.55171 type:complete len:214 (-) Transcript_20242:1174-1815(-)